MNIENNSPHDLPVKSAFFSTLKNKALMIIKQIGKFVQEVKRTATPIFKTLLKKGKKVWWMSGIVIIVIVIMVVAIATSTSSDSNRNNASLIKQVSVSTHTTQAGDYLQQRLQDISDQLATIRQRLDQSNSDALSQQVNGIIDQMKDLSSESNKLITDQIQASTATLQKQLQTINTALIKLQKEQEHVKYLKPGDLPFKVVSIDNIQQNNVVTIDYNDTTFPIEVGSYVAAWKLISADFVSQKAEFINSKKQHVVVDLNRMEKHRW